jgi:hypothetical protein
VPDIATSRNPFPSLILAGSDPHAVTPGATPRAFAATEVFAPTETPAPPTPVEQIKVVPLEQATRGLNQARERVEKAQKVADEAALRCESIRAAARAGTPQKPSSLTDAIAESEFASLRVRELRQVHELAQGTYRLAESDQQATQIVEQIPDYIDAVKDAAAVLAEDIAVYIATVAQHDAFAQRCASIRPGASPRVTQDRLGIRIDGNLIRSIAPAAISELGRILEGPFAQWGQGAAAQAMRSVVAGGPAPLWTR